MVGVTVLLVQGGSAWLLPEQQEGTDLGERRVRRSEAGLCPGHHPSSCGQICIIGTERQMQMPPLACEVSPASLCSGGALAHLEEILATC